MKKRFLFWLVPALMLAGGAMVSCSSSDDPDVPDTPIDVPDVVDNPVRVVRYEKSAQFKDDIQAFNQLAFVLRAMTWNYWMMASDGLKQPEDFFTVSPEDLGKNQPKLADEYLDMMTYLYDNLDAYQEAVDNLIANGVLTEQVETRGLVPLADGIDFAIAAKSSASMGRQAVMTILRAEGWSTDAYMLEKLYKQVRPEYRQGYNNYVDFWKDFSSGKMDNRSAQIFKELYSTSDDIDAQQFGNRCREIGVTPEMNMAVITQKMAQSGMSLIIDACPINIGSGVDVYNTAEVQLQVMFNSLKFNEDGSYEGINTDVLKNWVQQWGHNAMKYGRDFEKYMDKVNNNFQSEYLTNWDASKDWWIENVFQDLYEFSANETVFSNNLQESFNDHGKSVGLQTIVKVKELNGKPLECVYIVDPETGRVRLGFIKDEDGNIIMNAGTPGTKVVTVVNRQTGKRVTKEVKVKEGEDNEIELAFDEQLLEENPENGKLSLSETSWVDQTGEGGYKRITIQTNYMYYQCKTEEKWIDAHVATDANFLYVKLTKNDQPENPNDRDGKPAVRKGTVLVMATNSKGEVLKTATLKITQNPFEVNKDEGYIIATPSTVSVTGEGGSELVTLDHHSSYNHLGAQVGSDLSGWADVTPAGNGYMVKVYPNTEISDRSGTITFYAAVTASALDDALNGGRLDPEEVVKTTVVVKQTGGSTTIKLTPDALEFEAEKSKQSVKIDGGVYKYWDAYPDDNCVDWVKVILGNNWDFEVEVTANNSEEERTGFVHVLCYNDGEDPDGTGKKVTLKITQKGFDLEMKAYPDFFDVPADGGVYAVQQEYPVDMFKYYGYSVQDDGDGWVRAAVSNDYISPNRFKRQVFFTVAPNTTGQSRTAHIKMYLTNNQSNPENERVYMNDVTITQAAGPYTTMANIFCGNWLVDENNGPADQYGDYWCVRLKINPDYTFRREYRFTKEGGTVPGSWYTNAEGSFEVTGFTQNRLNIHVEVVLHYKNSNGENKTETTFFEVYPHFMRHGGFYLDRVEE